jgi:hypothetical protein
LSALPACLPLLPEILSNLTLNKNVFFMPSLKFDSFELFSDDQIWNQFLNI